MIARTVVTVDGATLDVHDSGVAFCNDCGVRIALWDDEEGLVSHKCECVASDRVSLWECGCVVCRALDAEASRSDDDDEVTS